MCRSSACLLLVFEPIELIPAQNSSLIAIVSLILAAMKDKIGKLVKIVVRRAGARESNAMNAISSSPDKSQCRIPLLSDTFFYRAP